MNRQKHIYYLTVSAAQDVAQDIIGRKLNKNELDRIIEKLRDKIQWYDELEKVISLEIEMGN